MPVYGNQKRFPQKCNQVVLLSCFGTNATLNSNIPEMKTLILFCSRSDRRACCEVSTAGPTLAEGELLIMAVRTPKAWMVILSVPFFQTYTPAQ